MLLQAFIVVTATDRPYNTSKQPREMSPAPEIPNNNYYICLSVPPASHNVTNSSGSINIVTDCPSVVILSMAVILRHAPSVTARVILQPRPQHAPAIYNFLVHSFLTIWTISLKIMFDQNKSPVQIDYN